MNLTVKQKLGFGSVLAVVGASGIVGVPLLGWSETGGAWDFLGGFLFGIAMGAGAVMCVVGLIEQRSA